MFVSLTTNSPIDPHTQYLETITMDSINKNLVKAVVNIFNPNRLANSVVRKKQVAMFHTGRCGSTVLGKLLKQNKDILWDGEIFEGAMVNRDANLSSNFVKNAIQYSSSKSVSKIYGFETKYLPQQHLSSNCLDLDLDSYISILEDLGFNYFIVLQRNNYLRRAISSHVGRQSGKWHSAEKTDKPHKVYIDVNNFQTGFTKQTILEHFECIDRTYEKLRKKLN